MGTSLPHLLYLGYSDEEAIMQPRLGRHAELAPQTTFDIPENLASGEIGRVWRDALTFLSEEACSTPLARA